MNKSYFARGTSSSTDNTRWQSSKTIYDPCPPGYRVPDGGSNGIWLKALGSSSSFTDLSLYDSIKEGFNFSAKFGNAPTIWYPLSGRLTDHAGELYRVCKDGLYWAVTPIDNHASHFSFFDNGRIYPSGKENRTVGCAVRCCKE